MKFFQNSKNQDSKKKYWCRTYICRMRNCDTICSYVAGCTDLSAIMHMHVGVNMSI